MKRTLVLGTTFEQLYSLTMQGRPNATVHRRLDMIMDHEEDTMYYLRVPIVDDRRVRGMWFDRLVVLPGIDAKTDPRIGPYMGNLKPDGAIEWPLEN